MATELFEAAQTMLAATSGMYIEYVPRAEDVYRAEAWLRLALRRAELTDEAMGDVLSERERQVALGWTAEHDFQHNPTDWHELIIGVLGKGVDDDDDVANTEYRQSLVQSAALCIAAVQDYDRKLPSQECDAGCRCPRVPGKRYCAVCRLRLDKAAAYTEASND